MSKKLFRSQSPTQQLAHFYVNPSGEHITAAWSATVDTWYHVAVTREDSYVRLFADGDESGGGTVNQDIGNNYSLSIGATGNLQLEITGYMDEVRIINGEAAWTATFVSPTISYGR